MAQSPAARFFDAFAARDGEAMAACYADTAQFSDPVFVDLDAAQTRAMWRMLTARAKDLRVDYRVEREDAAGARVAWNARYTFGPTRRPVENRVVSEMAFADGLIVRQVDSFDFWRWSRQALGPVGLMLGWTLWLRDRVRGDARAGLAKFLARGP